MRFQIGFRNSSCINSSDLLCLGSRDMYIPNGERLKDALRDIQIWREFKGDNIESLSRKFGLTERRITQIIKFQRAAYVARNQRSLF